MSRSSGPKEFLNREFMMLFVVSLRKLTLVVLFTTILVSGLPSTLRAQRGNPDKSNPFDRIPSLFGRQVDALGTRARAPGKEQVVYLGEFLDAITGMRSRLQVTHQLPGMIRIEGLKANGAAISFDGTRASGVLTRTDEAVLETLVTDTAEGMLTSVQRAAAFRFLGGDFVPKPTSSRNSTGPRFDIFEITAPLITASPRLLRMKLYFVDSMTGLLQRTRYEDRTISPSIKVETRFLQWARVDDSLYAGRIERYEDGRLVFSFAVSAVKPGPKVGVESFR